MSSNLGKVHMIDPLQENKITIITTIMMRMSMARRVMINKISHHIVVEAATEAVEVGAVRRKTAVAFIIKSQQI